jgi:hypothetical protein
VALGVWGTGGIDIGKGSIWKDELQMYDLDNESTILHGLQYSYQLPHRETDNTPFV